MPRPLLAGEGFVADGGDRAVFGFGVVLPATGDLLLLDVDGADGFVGHESSVTPALTARRDTRRP